MGYAKENLRIIGLNKVLDKRRPAAQRIIWSILIFFSLGFLVYHLYDRLDYFVRGPILVDVNILESEVIDFPAITICPSFPIKHQPIFTDPLSKEVWAAINRRGKRTGNTSLTREKLKNFDYRRFIRNLWPPLQIKQCIAVLNPTMRDLKSCSQKNFLFSWNKDLYWHSLKMPCYTILNGWNASVDSMFVLTLPAKAQGLAYRIAIHNKTDSPRLRENNAKVYAEVNAKTTRWNMYFTRTDISRVHSRCTNQTLRLFPKSTYTPIRCKAQCAVELMQNETCRCYVPLEVDHFDKQNICPPSQWKNCFMETWRKRNEFEKMCSCKPQCRRSFYMHSVDHYQIHDQKLARINGSFVKIYIKYLTTRYQVIEQREAFTFLRLLAEIGGALGLFLGIRILTIVEIFDVVIITLCCSKRRLLGSKKNERHEMEPLRPQQYIEPSRARQANSSHLQEPRKFYRDNSDGAIYVPQGNHWVVTNPSAV